MVSALCALGGGVCLLTVFGIFLLVVGYLVVTVTKKSKEKGVVIKDGISSEELGIVVEVINEQLATKKVSDVLAKVASAITEAQAARTK